MVIQTTRLAKLVNENTRIIAVLNHPFSGRQTPGFSLVELLVVMAIMALLAFLSVPALSSLKNSGNVNFSVNSVSLTLQQARSYAMAHNTYVWVGFYEAPGTDALTMGMVAGTTGSASDLSSSSTYSPISRPLTFSNLNIATVAQVEASNSSMTNNSAHTPWSNGTELDTSTLSTFTQTVAGTKITFPQGSILQFDPEGEANVSPTSVLPHWIQFGLQPIQGSTKNSNVAAIQISGLSGGIQVFRP